jgi:hypothetical protein
MSPRARIARLLVLGAVLVIAVVFAKKWPKDQMVHFMLGDAAPRVEELDARWSPGIASNDWVRESSYRFEAGKAPRVVTNAPRLADGDYTVEIEVKGTGGPTVIRKHVTLEGGSTTIELAGLVP